MEENVDSVTMFFSPQELHQYYTLDRQTYKEKSALQPVVYFDDVSRTSKFVFLAKNDISNKHVVIHLEMCPNFPTCLDPKCFYEHSFDEEGNRQSKKANESPSDDADAPSSSSLSSSTDALHASSSTANGDYKGSTSSRRSSVSTISSSSKNFDNAWDWGKLYHPELIGLYLCKRYTAYRIDIFQWIKVGSA